MNLSIRSLMLALAIPGIATMAFAQDPQAPESSADRPLVYQSPSRFTEGRVWLGVSTLNGKSDFWDDNFQHFNASRGDLDGFMFGGDFIKHLDLHNALMLSSGLDIHTISEPSRDVLNHRGDPLEHHLELATFALTAGYVFYPAGTQHSVVPYLGAGGGLYAGQVHTYRSSHVTDDCDEDGNCTTEYTDSKESNFLTFGYYALAGLEVPVTSGVSLMAEGRYTVANADLGGAFKAHGGLDLSGAQFLAGVAVRF
ncbi:MAG: hypothetical protein WAM82_23435 [Thermoanaerobaculia bacterium]